MRLHFHTVMFVLLSGVVVSVAAQTAEQAKERDKSGVNPNDPNLKQFKGKKHETEAKSGVGVPRGGPNEAHGWKSGGVFQEDSGSAKGTSSGKGVK